jgi:predicted nucleic acid-binding protein
MSKRCICVTTAYSDCPIHGEDSIKRKLMTREERIKELEEAQAEACKLRDAEYAKMHEAEAKAKGAAAQVSLLDTMLIATYKLPAGHTPA